MDKVESWIYSIIFCLPIIWVGVKYSNVYKQIIELAEKIDVFTDELEKYNFSNAIHEFNDIEKIFLNNVLLKNIWIAYSKTLIKFKDDDGNDVIYSTTYAEDFFNLENVFDNNKINISFWQNIGGIFTGLGIFGTFIGLTIGVMNINIQDTATMQNGIKNLLSGLSTAFFTSLVGIGSALIFNYYHKKSVERAKDAINKLNLKIESLYFVKSKEQILFESLAQYQEQTTQLKSFNTSLAISIGDALEQKLAQSDFAADIREINSSMQEINNILKKDLPEIIGQTIEEKMVPIFTDISIALTNLSNSGIDGIQKSMENSAGKELTAFAQSLQEMSNNMQQAISEMKTTSSTVNKELTDAVEHIVTKLDEQLEKATQHSVNQSAELERKAAAINENMSIIEEKVAGLLSEQSKANQDFNEQIKDVFTKAQNNLQVQYSGMEKMQNILNYLLDKANETAEKFQEAAVPVAASSKILANNLNTALDMQKQTNNNVEKLQNISVQTGQNIQLLSSEIKNAQATLSVAAKEYYNVNSELEKILTTMNTHIGKQNEQLLNSYRVSLNNYSQKLSEAYSNLATIVGALNEILEDIADDDLRRKK